MSVLEIIGAIAVVDIAIAVVRYAVRFVKDWRNDPDPLTRAEIRTGLLYLPWYMWQHRPLGRRRR